jgi:hypothetical protein
MMALSLEKPGKPGNNWPKTLFPGALFPGMFPGLALNVNSGLCTPLQRKPMIYQ